MALESKLSIAARVVLPVPCPPKIPWIRGELRALRYDASCITKAATGSKELLIAGWVAGGAWFGRIG